MNRLYLAALLAISMFIAAAPAGAQQRSAFADSLAAAAAPVEDEGRVAAPVWWSAQPGSRLPEAGSPLLLEATRDEMRRMPVAGYRLVGALAGAAVGILGYYVSGYEEDEYCREPDMFPCVPPLLIFGGGGALVGAVVGGFIGNAADRP